MIRRLPWPARLYPWRRWIVFAIVILIIRAFLPLALRKIAASQASQALHADVRIGNIDLWLVRGGVALEDVAVHPAHEAGTPEGPPLIAWKRLAVNLRWLSLFQKNIQLEEVLLDS